MQRVDLRYIRGSSVRPCAEASLVGLPLEVGPGLDADVLVLVVGATA